MIEGPIFNGARAVRVANRDLVKLQAEFRRFRKSVAPTRAKLISKERDNKLLEQENFVLKTTNISLANRVARLENANKTLARRIVSIPPHLRIRRARSTKRPFTSRPPTARFRTAPKRA